MYTRYCECSMRHHSYGFASLHLTQKLRIMTILEAVLRRIPSFWGQINNQYDLSRYKIRKIERFCPPIMRWNGKREHGNDDDDGDDANRDDCGEHSWLVHATFTISDILRTIVRSRASFYRELLNIVSKGGGDLLDRSKNSTGWTAKVRHTISTNLEGWNEETTCTRWNISDVWLLNDCDVWLQCSWTSRMQLNGLSQWVESLMLKCVDQQTQPNRHFETDAFNASP